MNYLNERIKELRNMLNLTQQEFADKIGTGRGNIAGYETGKRSPSEAVISLICQKFSVNESWLRKGEGEIFIQLTRNQQITDFLGDLIKEEGTFKKRLIDALCKLDEKDWEDFERLVDKLTKKD